jgi:hypothetical protein
VIVRDGRDAEARQFLAALRSGLGRKPGQPLHFLKFTHPQRLRAAQALAGSPIRAVTSVILCKEPLRDSQKTTLTGADPMYLYALRLLIERISWCVRRSGGREAKLTFAEVKGFQGGKLHDYRQRLEARSDVEIDWPILNGHPFQVARPGDVELLQIADTAASAIYQAVEPDPFGNTEPRYLTEMKPKIFCPKGKVVTSYGLKTFPTKVGKPGGSLHFLTKH